MAGGTRRHGVTSGRGIEWQRLQVAWVTSGSGVSVMGNECQEAFMLF